MKLSEKQQIFTTNIGKLIAYAETLEIGLTFGEAYRTQSQVLLYFFGFKVVESNGIIRLEKSRKLSKTLQSKHLDRLAVDFNFFINGKLTYDKHKLQALGNYWESLHKDNSWGGNWKFLDTPHFQMN